MTDHDEELARFKAEMDQAIEGVKVVGKASWALYQQAKEEGFDDAQALKVTLTWVNAMVLRNTDEE